MIKEKNQFRLDVRMNSEPPMKIDVHDTVTVGLDPRSDLVLSGAKIKNRHLEFHQKGENLALHYLGNTNQTFLNSLPLEEGRTYLLEPGDKIQLTGVEIIIRHELVHLHESQKVKAVIFNSLEELTPESAKDSIIYKDNPTGSMKRQPHVREPIVEKLDAAKKGELLSLWVIKIYALLTDAFITYAILAGVLPIVYADKYAFKVTNYLASLLLPDTHSAFLSFFIAWYLLSFAQTMIFGSTVGQFLLGLRNKNESTFGKLILFRMKTFFYSLFLLPAQNKVSENLFFKGIRKVGIIVIYLFILGAPLFLPPPYNKTLTVMKNPLNVNRELRTKTIMSHSQTLQMELSAELPPQYVLMPYIFNDKDLRSFQLVDLKSDKSIVVYEKDKISYRDIDEALGYANPLYSVLHKTSFNTLPLKTKKEIIADVLTLSPFNLLETTKTFGPFFGSAVLLKAQLLGANITNDTIVKFYAPETPVIFISSSQQDFFYLFTPEGLSRFVIDSMDREPLVSVFEQEIFTKLVLESEPQGNMNPNRVTILEAQDAFLHGQEQTFLTYYINEANSLANSKMIYADLDLRNKTRLSLIKNITTVQKFMTNKNVIKSFDDIKFQLTPMENPGVK